MPRVKIALFAIGFFILSLSSFAEAEREILKPGTVESYFSENGVYHIEIKFLGNRPEGIVEGTYYEKEQVKWKKLFSVHPGIVKLANNGAYLIFANWGWYDEGGFKSLTFYDGNGELIKEIKFDDKNADFGKGMGMLWIQEAAISNNCYYYAIGVDGKEKSEIYMFMVKEPNLLWHIKCGYERIADIEISDQGSVLAATTNYQDGLMKFSFADNKGDFVWEKESTWKVNNEIKEYLKFEGGNFGVLNPIDKNYIYFIVKEGKVLPKDEFLISKGFAGAIQCGMSAESLYSLYTRNQTEIVDLRIGGAFSPFLGIYFDNGKHPSLLTELGWLDKEGWILNRIWIYDPKFKTKSGIGVGSMLGDVRKTYEISWINEKLYGYIQELQIIFALAAAKVPEEFYKNTDKNLVPDEVKIEAICILNENKMSQIFSGKNTNYFFPTALPEK